MYDDGKRDGDVLTGCPYDLLRAGAAAILAFGAEHLPEGWGEGFGGLGRGVARGIDSSE